MLGQLPHLSESELFCRQEARRQALLSEQFQPLLLYETGNMCVLLSLFDGLFLFPKGAYDQNYWERNVLPATSSSSH